METIESLGKYEIKGPLGRGAMGTVYEGWDPITARRVAIKTVRLPAASDPQTEEALARFRREAQAAGGPAVQPAARCGAPGHQAGERDANQQRPGEDRRFRHRPHREQLYDPGRNGAGHAGLYVARAVHGPGGRRTHRHLFLRRVAVSVADRRAAVRRRHVGDHAQGAEHRSAGAVAAFGDGTAVVRSRGTPGDGEAAGGSLSVR